MQASQWEVKEKEFGNLQKAVDFYKEEAKQAIQERHMLTL